MDQNILNNQNPPVPDNVNQVPNNNQNPVPENVNQVPNNNDDGGCCEPGQFGFCCCQIKVKEKAGLMTIYFMLIIVLTINGLLVTGYYIITNYPLLGTVKDDRIILIILFLVFDGLNILLLVGRIVAFVFSICNRHPYKILVTLDILIVLDILICIVLDIVGVASPLRYSFETLLVDIGNCCTAILVTVLDFMFIFLKSNTFRRI